MIQTILFQTWFLISSYSVDDDRHNYLVHIKKHNVNLSLSLSEPLAYGEQRWIKLKVEADCNVVKTPFMVGTKQQGWHKDYFCSAEEAEEMKCTERNSFVVGGVRFC